MSIHNNISPLLVVLGAGESGIGTALLAQAKGYDVFVSDGKKIAPNYKKELIENHISFEEEQHSIEKIEKASLVMKSPGIPDHINVIKHLKELKTPIVSEIEFATTYTDATIIAITGSNGKTTTTTLIHHILKNAGLNVGLGGNIGFSFARLVKENKNDIYVLEISSFQLDDIVTFAPHIAIITNITPDHLDRYNNSFKAYTDAKFKIASNQTAEDYLLYDNDDITIKKWLEKNTLKAALLPFSAEKKLEKGAFIRDSKLILKNKNTNEIMDISTFKLQGKHNTKNALAAAMTASIQKVRNKDIRSSLEDFDCVEHRLEMVLKINGVQYINDSKATNINATYYALESMKKPVVWIVGGVDKGNDYLELMSLVREKVKAIVCLGIDNQKIITAFGNVIEHIVETNSATQAVQEAYKLAEKDDAVLLSPACASFDLFKNYEDRGRQFKEAVRKL